jgi:hypothetical protein
MEKKISLFVLIGLLILGFANSDTIDYLRVSKRLNIGTSTDSLVASNGTITSNSSWKIKSLITDTTTISSNVWVVSPAFTFNKYRKTSPSVKTVIDSLGSDSALIYVNPGTYTDRITAKTNVTIIGSSKEKVFFSRTGDSTVVYGYNVTNFNLSNVTIIHSTTASGEASGIKLYRCFSDSTALPKIRFDELRIWVIDNSSDTVAGILADSSSFKLTNSFIYVDNQSGAGNDRITGCVRVRNYSHPIVQYCILDATGDKSGALYSCVRVSTVDCRPIISYNQGVGDRFITAGDVTTMRSSFNISNSASVNLDNWFSTTYNIIDANFIIK